MANIRLTIKRLPSTDEWKVVVMKNGRYSEAESYYAGDLDDAGATMRYMASLYGSQGHTVEVGGRIVRAQQRREPNPNTKEDYEDAESLDRKLQYKREKDYEAAALLRYFKRPLADAERESKQAQRREPNPAHSRRQARKIGVLMRRGIIKKRGRRTKNPQSFAALLRRYDRNEDRNFHSENYLLLAKAYGTPEQVREVERILRLNRKLGHSDDAGRKWMYENINHYFKRLLADAERESKTPRRTKNFAHGMRYIRYMPQGSTRRTGNPRRRLGARRGDLGLLLSRPVKQILRVLYQRGYLADGTRAKMTAEARQVLLKLQRRGLVKHVGRVGKNARWTLTTAGWRVAG
jgi:hypothetical protein